MDKDSAETAHPQPTQATSPPPAPTTADQLYAAVVSHDATVSRHESRLRTHDSVFGRHEEALQDLQQTVSNLLAHQPPLSPSPAPTLPVSEPRLPTPERYNGNPADCRGFLTQCSLTFELQASTFRTDRARIAYIITLLTGRARAWATAIWEQQGSACSDYVSFTCAESSIIQ